MSKWLARLAFSFLIVAAVLFYEGSKRNSQAYYAAAILLLALGAIGMRERHRL